ncbi:MAG: hypothetical protein DBX55_01330 [Verrucomicrobia bacterium]|nr:MAG: hypothetical protein DBX55_01330 [Verrucomicrobiota bacterium]
MLQRIKIRALPNAPKSECAGAYMDCVKIRLSAPALDGKANAELVKFLSRKLGLPKSAIRIKSGERSREKIVELEADFDCAGALLESGNGSHAGNPPKSGGGA